MYLHIKIAEFFIQFFKILVGENATDRLHIHFALGRPLLSVNYNVNILNSFLKDGPRTTKSHRFRKVVRNQKQDMPIEPDEFFYKELLFALNEDTINGTVISISD